MRIAIIDYGLGNLASVYNALVFLGADAKISDSPKDVEKADRLVLPGVGAFGNCIEGLAKRGLIGPLKKFLASGKAYLGICLGLQILFERSEEGNEKGLSVFKGEVKRFRAESGVKVPHIGWNTVRRKDDNKAEPYFYFDHSYYAEPGDKSIVSGTTYHGVEFASWIQKGNINAVQFHPERSQKLGLSFLEKFIGS